MSQDITTIEISPRFAGMKAQALSDLLAELDNEVERYVGELDYRHAAAYAARAHIRFAAGYPAPEILDDCWMASRCLITNPELHLHRTPHERLLSRRITPIELALLGGDPELAKRMAGAYGLPVVAGRAGVADAELTRELRILSPALIGQPLRSAQDLLGLAAAVYAGALSAVTRGFADEALMAIELLAKAQYNGELSDGQKAVMVRYGGLCEALLELIRPGERDLGGILADQIDRHTSRTMAALGDQGPKAQTRLLDTGSLALLALATLIERPPAPFPPRPDVTPAACLYTEFLAVMAHGQQRQEES